MWKIIKMYGIVHFSPPVLGMATATPKSKCGPQPQEFLLKRGERQQLVFWSDQDYAAAAEFVQEVVETTTAQEEEESWEEAALNDNQDAFVDADLPATEQPETTTENDVEMTTLNDEIAYDDAEVFQEDFGSVIDNAPTVIFDPLDDIADVSGEIEIPQGVELIETPEQSSALFNAETSATTTISPADAERVFDYVDPLIIPSLGSNRPVFEPVVAEVGGDERPATDANGLWLDTTTSSASEIEVANKPVSFEAVLAEEDAGRPGATDAQGLLIDTTTSKDALFSEGSNFSFEAVVAEEDEDAPPAATDEKGLFFETTTGAALGKLNKVSKVSEALEKSPRGSDEDVAIEDWSIEGHLQDITVTQSPPDIVRNMTDPSDKPGSILTTLIDGFLLQKQPHLEEEEAGTSSEEPETAGGFPVTNILSGIYNLVSSYITPSDEEVDEEPITAIPEGAINVHNMPRDQLIVEAAAQESEEDSAPPLPVLPTEFLRGTPIEILPSSNKPRLPESLSGPVLKLNEHGSKGGTREPVNIPLPDLITDEEDAPRSIKNPESQLHDFLASELEDFQQHSISKRDLEDTTEDFEEDETTTTSPFEGGQDEINCSWNIKVIAF